MENLLDLIKEHPFWKGLDARHFPLLAEGAAVVHFAPGEMIYKEGGQAERFYLVLRGKAALEAFIPGRAPVTIQTVGRGDALGWSWLFPPYRWYFSARAIEETEALAWETSQLRANADRDREFGYELMYRMAQVLLQRLHATRYQLLDLYDAHP
jgi:CRP-like cAMP-binding protein